jgi:hypothetical protein
MPSCFSSLLLATSLGVLSGAPAQQPATSASTKAEVKTPVPSTSGRKPSTKVKAPGAKVAARPTSVKPTTATTSKAAAADCDLPVSTVAAVKPVPIAADPLAPTLAPCAEPTKKP